VACFLAVTPLFAAHGQAPEWMHAVANAPLPAHDAKTNAVLLYAEDNLTVISADKFRTVVRVAYKILRPEGRDYGTVVIPFNSFIEKVTSIHAWCIPADGKDYEVTDKDAMEMSPLKGEDVGLITGVREKGLLIPAPDPGNIVGYEYVTEQHPLVLQDGWNFQETIPVREIHYSLALPPGWEFKDAWLNYPEVKPRDMGGGQWQWTVRDVKAIRLEPDMPPWQGVAGQMVVTLFPPGGAANSFPIWHDAGEWYLRLTSGRLDASPEIKQEVSALKASAPTPFAKMQALAEFVQRNIRSRRAIRFASSTWRTCAKPTSASSDPAVWKPEALAIGAWNVWRRTATFGTLRFRRLWNPPISPPEPCWSAAIVARRVSVCCATGSSRLSNRDLCKGFVRVVAAQPIGTMPTSIAAWEKCVCRKHPLSRKRRVRRCNPRHGRACARTSGSL